MNVYQISLENEQEKYKSAYLRAESFAVAEAKARVAFPDHKITNISLEGDFVE